MTGQEFFSTKLFENKLVNSGFGDLVFSPFLQRLKGVSFLATMDHIYDVEQPFSRYDHSLGSAFLALILSEQLELSNDQKEILVIANLLHDIGHTPFSHAAETFLFEKVRKYHEGLASSYLRFNTRLLPDSFSLSEILSSKPRKVEENVTNLLKNNPTGDEIIDSIHYCTINCDKIDGTNRALFSIGSNWHEPFSLIKSFSSDGKTIFFNRKSIDDLIAFWQKEITLYNKYIYNFTVLSAEAMLTRALSICFHSKKLVNMFLGSTDKNAYKFMESKEISKNIINSFFKKKMFLPLSSVDMQYYYNVEPKLRSLRFDLDNRRKIENEIADYLGVNPLYTISHFSFKKEFKTNLNYTYQLELFESDNNSVSLHKINKAFRSVRLSGDVLDVFIPLYH